jgi:hypothetical protein
MNTRVERSLLDSSIGRKKGMKTKLNRRVIRPN